MISHGYAVKEYDDPIVDIAEAAMNQFSELVDPGAYLVDTVPLCGSPISRRPTAGGIDRISLSLGPERTVQCDTSPSGSLERGGKRRSSGMPTL